MRMYFKSIISFSLVCLILCFGVAEVIGQASTSRKPTKPKPKPKHKQEVIWMAAGSNHEVEWERNKQTGQLNAISDKAPGESYKPLLSENSENNETTTPITNPVRRVGRSVPCQLRLIGRWRATSENGSIDEFSIEKEHDGSCSFKYEQSIEHSPADSYAIWNLPSGWAIGIIEGLDGQTVATQWRDFVKAYNAPQLTDEWSTPTKYLFKSICTNAPPRDKDGNKDSDYAQETITEYNFNLPSPSMTWTMKYFYDTKPIVRTKWKLEKIVKK